MAEQAAPGGGSEAAPSRFAGCGVVYVAFGYEYLVLAAHSARTLKRHNAGLTTLLVTNVAVEPLTADGLLLFDQVILSSEESAANRKFKLAVDEVTPFDRTVYLDCDTEVRGDLWPAFRLLETYDMAVRLLNKPTTANFEVYPGHTARSLGMAEWNAGVLFFRKSEGSSAVFRKWREIFVTEQMSRDQPALLRAILATPDVRLLPLPPEWNAKPSVLDEYYQVQRHPESIRIFHYREPFRRPEIARDLYRTFLDIRPKLALGASVALLQEESRFRLLYSAYSWFLKPLNNRVGRRLLRYKNPLVGRILNRLVRVRGLLAGHAELSVGRDRKVVGKPFSRSR